MCPTHLYIIQWAGGSTLLIMLFTVEKLQDVDACVRNSNSPIYNTATATVFRDINGSSSVCVSSSIIQDLSVCIQASSL